ncbi:metallophosphoesterase family protein [Streptomyces sp. SD15]
MRGTTARTSSVPWTWEGPSARRYGPVGKVAVVSDMHANVAAPTAVLAETEEADVDLVVSCGDLTWGAEPDRRVALMTGLPRALFVRGNGERAVRTCAAAPGGRAPHGRRGCRGSTWTRVSSS